jgi:hypothetical protein
MLRPYIGISRQATFREAEHNTLTLADTDVAQGIKQHFTDGVRTTPFKNPFLLLITRFSLSALVDTFPNLGFWLDPSVTPPRVSRNCNILVSSGMIVSELYNENKLFAYL